MFKIEGSLPRRQQIKQDISQFSNFEQDSELSANEHKADLLMRAHEEVGGLTREKKKKSPELGSIEDRSGAEHLEHFIHETAQEYNLFYLDKDITPNELKQRIDLLDTLYDIYKNSSSDQRNYIEQIINQMMGTPYITEGAQDYLDGLAASPEVEQKQGAENKSFIFTNDRGNKEVIKISKDRHADDFTSILKLMRNMHAVMLELNQPPIQLEHGPEVEIRAIANDMLVYQNQDRQYHRMIRQDFAQGKAIQELTEAERQDPDFQIAWAYFLDQVQQMKRTQGIVMDITDSSAGYKKARGDVANTANVFVQKEGNRYIFQIIDIDVFDTVKGEHKFDPTETAHSRFGFGSPFKAVITRLMNYFRDGPLVDWQDETIDREQKKASRRNKD